MRGIKDPKKVQAMRDAQLRQQLLGQLSEWFRLRGLEAPVYLGALSLSDLRNHYDEIRNPGASASAHRPPAAAPRSNPQANLN